MFGRPSFIHVLATLLVLSFIAGFAVFVVSGATTNKGTPNAIEAEGALIRIAEQTRCIRFGSYASIATLRRERLLAFKPVYNSVVYVPGKQCGTIVIGSPAYQSSAG